MESSPTASVFDLLSSAAASESPSQQQQQQQRIVSVAFVACFGKLPLIKQALWRTELTGHPDPLYEGEKSYSNRISPTQFVKS